MEDNNELIEQFWTANSGKHHRQADLSFYESSWDMLMPVVEKIYRLEEDGNRIARFSLQNSRAVIKSGKKVFACHTISPINSTYRVVVEFIKWYNENKS